MDILRVSLDLQVDGKEFASSADLLQALSHNLGNLAFVYASSRLFPGQHKVLASELLRGAIDPAGYDFLLFPAANNLGSRSDLGWLADLMETVAVPILIIGMGVQAPIGGGEVKLPEGSLRFLDLIKQRGTPIGVRGEKTKEFLQSHGVTNVLVTGCPSIFINLNPKLGEVLMRKYAHLPRHPTSVALNLEYFSLDAIRTQKLVRWGLERGGDVVLQSDQRLIALLRGDLASDAEGFVKYAADYFLGTKDTDELRRWLARHCRAFFHTPSWIDYLRSTAFSTGTRFHGNMLAIQAETPALVLYHDQRTQEMAETMKIPSAPWMSLDSVSLVELIGSIEFDGQEFDENRRMLAGRVIDLAAQVGIPVVDQLRSLASG